MCRWEGRERERGISDRSIALDSAVLDFVPCDVTERAKSMCSYRLDATESLDDQTAHKVESTFTHAHREKTVTSVCCLQFICTLRGTIYMYTIHGA